MNYGKKIWVISGGRIPFKSHGKEPEFTSYDKVAVLNISEHDAEIEIYVYYEDKDPVGPFQLKVNKKRLRKIRFNDLIDPQPIVLEENFACVIHSSTPVIVQFSRQDTRQKENAILSTMAFSS